MKGEKKKSKIFGKPSYKKIQASQQLLLMAYNEMLVWDWNGDPKSIVIIAVDICDFVSK